MKPSSSSVPSNCPMCGAQLEGGALRARQPPGIIWQAHSERPDLVGREEKVPGTGLFFSTSSAVRCAGCRIIFLSYSVEPQVRRLSHWFLRRRRDARMRRRLDWEGEE
jgi:hypothetical protein